MSEQRNVACNRTTEAFGMGLLLDLRSVMAASKPEYPQHCTTPEKCIAAGRCTRDPNCID